MDNVEFLWMRKACRRLFDELPDESHEDEVDVGVRETCFFGAYLQDMKKGGDRYCTFARLDIVKGVLADVVLSR